MSKKNTNQKPFDVVLNEKIFLGKSHMGCGNGDVFGNLIKVKWEDELKPNLKIVVKMGSVPITSTQKQMNQYMSDNDLNWRDKKFKHIPYMNWEVETNDKGEFTSITLIQKIKGKYFKVVSQKDYGIIKSRFQLDEKGNFKNYEKCDLIPYDGKMIICSVDKSDGYSYYSHRDFEMNIKNGLLDGECVRNYKGSNGEDETTTYKDGKKHGLYNNTKSGVQGNFKNGKKDGEWVEKLNLKEMIGENVHSELRKLGGFSLGVDSLYNVNYTNGKLNGNFQRERGGYHIKGFFIDGKLCGDLLVGEHKIPMINNLVNGEITSETKYDFGSEKISLEFQMGEFKKYKKDDSVSETPTIEIKTPKYKLIFKEFFNYNSDRTNTHWFNKDLVDNFNFLLPQEVKEILKNYTDEIGNDESGKSYTLVYYNLDNGESKGGLTDYYGSFDNYIVPNLGYNNWEFYQFKEEFIKYNSIYGFTIDGKFHMMNDGKVTKVFKGLNSDYLNELERNHIEWNGGFYSKEIENRFNEIKTKYEKLKDMRIERKKMKDEILRETSVDEIIGSFDSFPID